MSPCPWARLAIPGPRDSRCAAGVRETCTLREVSAIYIWLHTTQNRLSVRPSDRWQDQSIIILRRTDPLVLTQWSSAEDHCVVSFRAQAVVVAERHTFDDFIG